MITISEGTIQPHELRRLLMDNFFNPTRLIHLTILMIIRS